MSEDLKIIKKNYGEQMSHLCRKLFPTLLETEGLVPELLLSHFEASHFLYSDFVKYGLIEDFKKFILDLIEIQNTEEIDTGKNPEELMLEANYILKECKTEEEIQSYKKYYAPGEELCTFLGNRLNHCHVFFAVKKDVDTIKREDFKHPERQDLYGTSVISIQFERDDSHLISIKNRYNHIVDNCDATFSNNLDKIIPGLAKSFEKTYNLKSEFKYDFNIVDHGYVLGNDGKYYKYNYEINQIYYCLNNIIIDHGEVKKLDKSKYIVLDYFILDLMNKKIFLYDSTLNDSFIDGIDGVDKISVEIVENLKTIKITPKVGEITIIILDKTNKIIEYKNNNIVAIRDKFLKYNKVLETIEMKNVTEIGDEFLYSNIMLTKINLDSVENIGAECLSYNKKISVINLPKVKSIKSEFLCHGENLLKFYAPLLLELGSYSFMLCSKLKIFDCPSLEILGNGVLVKNNVIIELELPNALIIGNDFMKFNLDCSSFKAKKLKKVGNDFFTCNEAMTLLDIENLEEAGNNFLCNNTSLPELILPNVTTIGDYFLTSNTKLKRFYADSLKVVGAYFMGQNNALYDFQAEKLEQAGERFLSSNANFKDYLTRKDMGKAI